MVAKPKAIESFHPMAADYDQDVVAWSLEQARLLRAGRFDLLDIEHLADEIEDVGKSEKRELASRIVLVLAHWLKWQYQPTHRSVSWRNTINEQRKQVWRRLKRTPSLRAVLDDPDFVEDVWSDARAIASRETGLNITSFPTAYPSLLLNEFGEEWPAEGEDVPDDIEFGAVKRAARDLP